MAKHYIRSDITTPTGAPHIYYPDGWDAYKILVRAYDDPNRACLAELEDEGVFQKLMASGKVEELDAGTYNSEIARLRPPPAEAQVVLSGKGKDHRTEIENFLRAKGLTVRIEER